MKQTWLTPAEVAARCGVAVAAVWAWIRRGKLKAYRFGRSYRIDCKDFDEFMREASPQA